jgi:hypothetical protein
MARVERTSSTEGDPEDGLDAAGSGGSGSFQDNKSLATSLETYEIRHPINWSINNLSHTSMLLPLYLDGKVIFLELRLDSLLFSRGTGR